LLTNDPKPEAKPFFSAAYVQRELFYWKIRQALCGVPTTVKGRSVARCPRPFFF